MSIEKIFKEFEQDIHELSFYVDMVKESYDKYLLQIEENKKNHPSIDIYSSKRPVYFDIKNNHKKIISDLSVTKALDQKQDDIVFHFNKQMQWFLVEVYELYENFIEKLYSTIGYLDNNFWDASDFGNIQCNSIKNKDESWFYTQVQRKKKKPYSIQKVFEKRLNLTQYFNKTIPTENYQFLMKLIAEFRHAIVHNHGLLDNRTCMNKIIKNSGINGSELIKKYEEYISIYYEDMYESLICLTTITDNKAIPELPLNYDRRLILTQVILSYSFLLTQLSIKYLESKQS